MPSRSPVAPPRGKLALRERLIDVGVVKGRTVGIDATTLETHAAVRSMVRRETGDGYERCLRWLAATSGSPTRASAELARGDRTRPKKGTNEDWTFPQDPDAKIPKITD